ncbi:GGDEF domain-containing protein, partial [bacterium]|nr:GGDEF domain-containing protein [bacterium]
FMEALANQAAIAIDNAKLYELATKDGLTKLYTHRHFFTLLDTEIKRAARYNHVMSVVMMDIDNFKSINDTYGHAVGDKVLREVASVIAKTVRKIDMPARYGGEEFAVILPETKGEDATIIAHRLRRKVEAINLTLNDGTVVKVTVSVGIAAFPDAAEDELTLMDFADKALYESKHHGKNCVHLYNEGKFVFVENRE